MSMNHQCTSVYECQTAGHLAFLKTLTSCWPCNHSDLFISYHIELNDCRLKPHMEMKQTSEMIEPVIFSNIIFSMYSEL